MYLRLEKSIGTLPEALDMSSNHTSAREHFSSSSGWQSANQPAGYLLPMPSATGQFVESAQEAPVSTTFAIIMITTQSNKLAVKTISVR